MSKSRNVEKASNEKTNNLIDRLKYAYVRKIKKFITCPICNGKMRINHESSLWQCANCNYELSVKEFENQYVFWFCDGCGVYLNSQQGFDINSKNWVCNDCGYDNDITSNNIKGLCVDCGKLLSNPKKHLCTECEFSRLKAAHSILHEASVVLNDAASTVSAIYGLDDSNDSTTKIEHTDLGDIIDSNGSDYPVCDCCGASMTLFDGCWWYTCPQCGNSVKKNSDSSFTWEREIFGQSSKTISQSAESNTMKCINCSRSLAGGTYTAPWESDANPDGYVKCPHCGYINFEWED